MSTEKSTLNLGELLAEQPKVQTIPVLAVEPTKKAAEGFSHAATVAAMRRIAAEALAKHPLTVEDLMNALGAIAHGDPQ